MKVLIGNLGKEDKERSLLPTIVVAKQSDPPFVAYGVGIGWWKWGIRISHAFKRGR